MSRGVLQESEGAGDCCGPRWTGRAVESAKRNRVAMDESVASRGTVSIEPPRSEPCIVESADQRKDGGRKSPVHEDGLTKPLKLSNEGHNVGRRKEADCPPSRNQAQAEPIEATLLDVDVDNAVLALCPSAKGRLAGSRHARQEHTGRGIISVRHVGNTHDTLPAYSREVRRSFRSIEGALRTSVSMPRGVEAALSARCGTRLAPRAEKVMIAASFS